MGFYRRYCVPMAIEAGCGTRPVAKQREKIVPLAEGRVLEVGFGAGHNLAYYDPSRVNRVLALEPDPHVRKRAAKRVRAAPFEVDLLNMAAEEIPLEDRSVETVVITFTLCTISGWQAALHQMRRVLRPGGRMLFCEHGRARDAGVARWQDRINPVWRPIAGGCNINRPIAEMIRQTGWRIDRLETMYLPGTPKVLGFNSWGAALPA